MIECYTTRGTSDDAAQAPRQPLRLHIYPLSHSLSVSLSSKHISSYVNRLLTTTRATEHRTIENFILCTKEAEDTDYKTVQRNVRQFVDGMRNFIIAQHGAGLFSVCDC